MAPKPHIAQTKPRIALLDSGVGGLSIAVPYSQHMVGKVTVDYLADNGHYPYGTKAQPELIRRVLAVVAAYLAKHPDCQQLIVACNTASTLCLDALRSAYTLPIIGVVPALKPACAESEQPQVGLLATKATVARPYIDELMAKFGGGKQLIKIGSQSLVDLAERLLADPTAPADATTTALLRELHAELHPLRTALNRGEMDTIVLGCTHFPWLKATLRILLTSEADPDLKLMDSTIAIIRRSLEVAGLQAIPSEPAADEIMLPAPGAIAGCYYTTAKLTEPSYAAELFARCESLGLS